MKIMLIGRWQPFHLGHKAMIDEALASGKEVVVGIRDTKESERNPFSSTMRLAMILNTFKEKPVEVILIPDISEIWVGRDVGYKVMQVDYGKDISGREIRRRIRNGRDFSRFVPDPVFDLLNEYIRQDAVK